MLLAASMIDWHGGSWDNAKWEEMTNPKTGEFVICSSVGLDTPPPNRADLAKFDACGAEHAAAGFLPRNTRSK